MKIENDNLMIINPSYDYKEDIWAFRQEVIDLGEDMIPGGGGLFRASNFEEWIAELKLYEKEETCPEGKVPAVQFITVRKSDNKVVGVINVRLKLNAFLEHFAGHIGDCVRPSERKKGYGSAQISLALKYCKEINLSPIMITCKVDNIASDKTILNNGGVLNSIVEHDGEKFKKYFIDTTKL